MIRRVGLATLLLLGLVSGCSYFDRLTIVGRWEYVENGITVLYDFAEDGTYEMSLPDYDWSYQGEWGNTRFDMATAFLKLSGTGSTGSPPGLQQGFNDNIALCLLDGNEVMVFGYGGSDLNLLVSFGSGTMTLTLEDATDAALYEQVFGEPFEAVLAKAD